MSYIDNNLGPGERVVHRGSIHWAIGLPWFLLAGVFLISGQEGSVIGVMLLLIGALRILIGKTMYEYAITNKRVAVKRGLIFRDTIELNLNKVESASVNQGITGRLLGYGTVTVRGSGGTSGKCTYLSNPTHFRRALNQAIEGDLPSQDTLATTA